MKKIIFVATYVYFGYDLPDSVACSYVDDNGFPQYDKCQLSHIPDYMIDFIASNGIKKTTYVTNNANGTSIHITTYTKEGDTE